MHRNHPHKTNGKKRSNKWPTVRKHFLEKNPTCAVCGGKEKLEIHHMQPFHNFPDLELDETNLITLCENGKNGLNCHLFIGHIGDFKSFNKNVLTDSKIWHDKIKNRP